MHTDTDFMDYSGKCCYYNKARLVTSSASVIAKEENPFSQSMLFRYGEIIEIGISNSWVCLSDLLMPFILFFLLTPGFYLYILILQHAYSENLNFKYGTSVLALQEFCPKSAKET